MNSDLGIQFGLLVLGVSTLLNAINGIRLFNRVKDLKQQNEWLEYKMLDRIKAQERRIEGTHKK